MKKGFAIIWIISIILISNIVYAEEVSTDVLVNIVRQETDKVKNGLTIHLDTKFTELNQKTQTKFDELQENLNNDIDSKMQWQLIKLGVGGLFAFLLAMFLSKLMFLRQERRNPYFIDQQKKTQELKDSNKIIKSQKEVETEKLKMESVKEKLNQQPNIIPEKKGLFNRFKKQPQQQVQQPFVYEPQKPAERTFTKEEVLALMQKQKQELSQPKEEESDLDKMYEEMK